MVYDITIIDCLGGIYLVLLTYQNHIDLELRSRSIPLRATYYRLMSLDHSQLSVDKEEYNF